MHVDQSLAIVIYLLFIYHDPFMIIHYQLVLCFNALWTMYVLVKQYPEFIPGWMQIVPDVCWMSGSTWGRGLMWDYMKCVGSIQVACLFPYNNIIPRGMNLSYGKFKFYFWIFYNFSMLRFCRSLKSFFLDDRGPCMVNTMDPGILRFQHEKGR